MQAISGNGNPLEKQRLRDTIREEISHYLASGGAITVLESDGDRHGSRPAVWHGDHAFEELLD